VARVICESDALADGGRGVRFTLRRGAEQLAAFAIRHRGEVHAYLNRCAHRGVELDWNPGDFFAAAGGELVCTTHDARYDPRTGECIGGPCRGGRLEKLAVVERDGEVCLAEGDALHLAGEISRATP
jgi:nitrite reductase/ring-hydroxylating ferredoxin subunit